MIKPEWINERNGFKVGERVLYLNPSAHNLDSGVFVLASMKAEVIDAPGHTNKPVVAIEIRQPNSPYHTKFYLEPDGQLYPIDSILYYLWNPAVPGTRDWPVAFVDSTGVGGGSYEGRSSVVTYRLNHDREWQGAVMYQIPAWAEKHLNP